MKSVKQKIEKPNAKDTELIDQLARALADYDNLRKRTEKEKEEIIKLANLAFFLKLAPIIDNIKNAQRHLKDKGLENIIRELIRILSEEGIENIEAGEGVKFDENSHEAIEIQPVEDEQKSGLISKVALDGWRIKNGPVIRPAKVVVFKLKAEN